MLLCVYVLVVILLFDGTQTAEFGDESVQFPLFYRAYLIKTVNSPFGGEFAEK